MSAWGVKSNGGIVTEAPSEIKARHWAAYDFGPRLGYVGERLVRQDGNEWVEQVEL